MTLCPSHVETLTRSSSLQADNRIEYGVMLTAAVAQAAGLHRGFEFCVHST